jgi:hypothetical protein
MRRTTLIIGTLALLAIALAVIVMVFSKSKSTASPEVVAELRAEMERRDGLLNERVIELLKDKAGQDALAELAEDYDKLFYNGDKRFVAVSPISSGAAEEVVGLNLYEGDQDFAFPISYTILLLNASMDDQFDVEFKEESVIVTLVSADKSVTDMGANSVVINWPHGTAGPYGYYNFETGETDLNK